MLNIENNTVTKNKKNLFVWIDAYNYAIYEAKLLDHIVKDLNGENYKYNVHCPLCKSSKKTFKVYEKTNSYCCFKCGSSGKLVNYIMQKNELTFKESVHLIFLTK